MVTNPQTAISDALCVAIGSVLDIPDDEIDPIVRRSQNPEHGDYQANGVMGLGKRFGQNPQELAQKIVSIVDFGGLADPPEVAGPGFINIRLTESTVQAMVGAATIRSGARFTMFIQTQTSVSPAVKPCRVGGVGSIMMRMGIMAL